MTTRRTVLVHGQLPVYVEVDVVNGRVLQAWVDHEEFRFEDPVLVTDTEGQPSASALDIEVGYDVAARAEGAWDWWPWKERGDG